MPASGSQARRDTVARSMRVVTGWYVAGLAVAMVASNASVRWWGVTDRGTPGSSFPGESLLGWMLRWDGNWYRSIAVAGYSVNRGSQSNVAFFPAYPLAMRGGGWVLGDPVLAGIALTVLSAIATICALVAWCADHGVSSNGTRLAVLSLLVYPYGWYLYGVVYSDALFLALVIWAFVMLDRDRVLFAALLAAAATATRPTGIPVLIALVAVQLQRRGAVQFVASAAGGRRRPVLQLTRLHRRDGWLCLSGLGLVSFSVFLWVRFGDPLLFWRVQRYWGQASGLDTLMKRPLWWEFEHLVHRSFVVTSLIQAALVGVAIWLVPAVARRFGWGYAALSVALAMTVIVSSSTFVGSGRYLLLLFPVFALAGERLEAMSARARRVVVAGSGFAALVMVVSFAHGVYLA